LNMGLTAEELAKEYGITREEADAFSVSSHDKALAAIAAGKFKDEIVPVEVEETYLDEKGKKKTRKFTVDTDEGPRAGTTMEALAALKPAFRMGGQVTAGNSSQTSDGAAFVVVMSERLMKSLGLDPVARMMSYSVAGVDPTHHGNWSQGGRAKGPQASGTQHAGPRFGGIERGLCCASTSSDEIAGHGSFHRQCKWRSSCFGSPTGLYWSQAFRSTLQ